MALGRRLKGGADRRPELRNGSTVTEREKNAIPEGHGKPWLTRQGSRIGERNDDWNRSHHDGLSPVSRSGCCGPALLELYVLQLRGSQASPAERPQTSGPADFAGLGV